MMKRFKAGKLLAIRGGISSSVSPAGKRDVTGAVLRYFIRKPKEDDRTIIGKALTISAGFCWYGWLVFFYCLT